VVALGAPAARASSNRRRTSTTASCAAADTGQVVRRIRPIVRLWPLRPVMTIPTQGHRILARCQGPGSSTNARRHAATGSHSSLLRHDRPKTPAKLVGAVPGPQALWYRDARCPSDSGYLRFEANVHRRRSLLSDSGVGNGIVQTLGFGESSRYRAPHYPSLTSSTICGIVVWDSAAGRTCGSLGSGTGSSGLVGFRAGRDDIDRNGQTLENSFVYRIRRPS